MSWWKNAFAIRDPAATTLTPRQEEILDRLASEIVARRMALPATLFLESVRPLNFVGSQIMAFIQPIVKSMFTFADYDEILAMMEERGNVDRLVKRIETKDASSRSGAGGG